jgi:hypothetical protein
MLPSDQGVPQVFMIVTPRLPCLGCNHGQRCQPIVLPARLTSGRIFNERFALSAAALLALGPLAACGSSHPAPAKPKISSAAACKGFDTWFLAYGTHKSVKGIGELATAVSQAPSGTLYQDISTLEANVKTAAAMGGQLGQAEFGMVADDAQQVETDCQSINPQS